LGLFQHDINVIWDLAPHDLSILHYLLSDINVVAVSANGIANYYDYENIAQLSLIMIVLEISTLTGHPQSKLEES